MNRLFLSLAHITDFFSANLIVPILKGDKKKKNLSLFYIKTTTGSSSVIIFVVYCNLIIFVMEKDSVKRISVWEKVSDFMMDISKSVLTAVIITSDFEELSDVAWMMYLWGILGAVLLLTVSIFMIHIANRSR